MVLLSNKRMALGSLVASAASSAFAFHPVATTSFRPKITSLSVAVDPSTITKKDYEEICGTSFDENALHEQLKSTKLLYPKHVDVIEDISPVADVMVNEIVRPDSALLKPLCCSANLNGRTKHVTSLLFMYSL